MKVGFHRAAHHGMQMEEALIAFCLFAYLIGGEKGIEFHGYGGGVYHYPLGASGMNSYALYGYHGVCGVEVFVFYFPYGAAVYCVGKIAAQLSNIKSVRAFAHFLVGGEYRPYFAMGNVIGHHGFQRGHYFGNAGLVVSPKESRTVGDNYILAHIIFKAGAEGFAEGYGIAELQLTALIVYYGGLYIFARSIGRGVHVGNKAQHGSIRAAIGGQSAYNIAAGVHADIRKAHLLHFSHQGIAQFLLPLSGGGGV